MNSDGRPKVPGFDAPPIREELPEELGVAKLESFAEYHPLAVVQLATKGSRVVELPDLSGYPPRVQKTLKNLAQYRGRSFEGNLRAFQNLRKAGSPMSMPDPSPTPTVPADVPAVTVPTMVPDIPRFELLRGRALKVCMSKQEYDLYVENWVKWFTAHKEEYTLPEDEDDVHRVCIETVIQFRIEREMQRSPSKDFSKQYDSSFKRMQVARHNLSARRRDRIDQKNKDKGGGNTFNIAFIAGMTPERMQQREQQAIENKTKVADFLEGTVVRAKQQEAAEHADE